VAVRKPWYDVLKAARRASKNGTDLLTAAALSEDGFFKPYGDRGIHVASAWLSKFVRWGYAVREGSQPSGKAWARTYRLTKWGLKFRPKG
jgi:hypothetical protein